MTITPLSNTLYTIPKAQVLFKPEGENSYLLMGDADDVNLAINIEENERYTNECGVRSLVKTVVTQKDAELNMTMLQFSNFLRAVSLLGQDNDFVQTASTGIIENFTAVQAGRMYNLANTHTDPATIDITDGTTLVAYVEGTDYEYDAKAGIVELISIPGGADADIIVTYDLLAVTAAEDVLNSGILAANEFNGAIIIRGCQDEGPEALIELHNVQLRPNAARNFIQDTDFDTVELIGKVLRDTTQAAGFELGFERDIS